jgi:hypothetical protein
MYVSIFSTSFGRKFSNLGRTEGDIIVKNANKPSGKVPVPVFKLSPCCSKEK